jgi:hypothetical protein
MTRDTLGQATLGTLTYTYGLAGRGKEVGGTWARTGLPQALGPATYDGAIQPASTRSRRNVVCDEEMPCAVVALRARFDSHQDCHFDGRGPRKCSH